MSETIVADAVVTEEVREPGPALHLHDIERTYRQGDEALHILRGADLAVWPGQSVALLAPSGAGKSTLLHIAGLLEQPDQGDVFIHGRPGVVHPPKKALGSKRDLLGQCQGTLQPVEARKSFPRQEGRDAHPLAK